MRRSKVPDGYLTLGGAARALGVSTDTLRRWEAAGFITLERTVGGWRVMAPDELERVRARLTAQRAHARHMRLVNLPNPDPTDAP